MPSVFFNDFANAVNNYPSNEVTLSFVGATKVLPPPAGGDANINVDETWRFRVRVTNAGHLNLTNVQLHVSMVAVPPANRGLSLNEAAGPWSANAFLPVIVVNNHSSADSGFFYFRPAGVTPGANPADLFRVHIHEFNANLNHIMDAHDGNAGTPDQAYSNRVFPA